MHARSIGRARCVLWTALTLGVVVGCEAGEDAPPDGYGETCGEPGDSYSSGMSKLCDDGTHTIVLVASDPGPPDKGDNVFTIELLDEAGLAVVDAEVVVTPFMPEHGHGTTPENFSTAWSEEESAYVSEPIDLFMGGLWDLTFTGTTTDGEAHEAMFTFCLEG